MKRILEILQRLAKGDKKALGELLSVALTGEPEEKLTAIILMKIHKDVAQAAVSGFVKRFLALNPKKADAFINTCEMMGVPEEDCISLLKLKGITFDDDKEEEMKKDLEDALDELKDFFKNINED